MSKSCEQIFSLISNRISSLDFLSLSRKKSNCFIRSRKMPFSEIIYFMLNSVKKTLQIELTNFMLSFTQHKNITKSAYSQARMNLNAEAFIDLNNLLINKFYTDNTIKLWNQFRLVCIDSSTLELPKSNEILKCFGHDKGTPMTRISVMYDPLNEMIIDSIIDSYYSSELYLAVNHFDKLKSNDLVIMDRGYGARWLFFLLLQKQVDFVIRIQKGFGKEIDEFFVSEEFSKIIEVNELPEKSRKVHGKNTPFKFRVVKVKLDNGEVEVLATSLLDEKKYPTQIFKELYFKRWGEETHLNHLKNHVEIGNFTGLSSLTIKQDFYANMLISNVQMLILQEAQKKLEKQSKKYEYKINKNLSLGYMKDRIIRVLKNNEHNKYEELVKLFLIEPVPIRPRRKNPRNPKRTTKKYYINQKRSL
ncbi:MAG: IS4 family transposase [Nanoarchaeota archaeon]|nr:IS4 family transposase [Nanoarchaeota archaeon]